VRVREREESCKRQKMRIQKVKCNVNVSATVLLPNNIFTWYNDNNANATALFVSLFVLFSSFCEGLLALDSCGAYRLQSTVYRQQVFFFFSPSQIFSIYRLTAQQYMESRIAPLERHTIRPKEGS
jgi:hypothetical protein